MNNYKNIPVFVVATQLMPIRELYNGGNGISSRENCNPETIRDTVQTQSIPYLSF